MKKLKIQILLMVALLGNGLSMRGMQGLYSSGAQAARRRVPTRPTQSWGQWFRAKFTSSQPSAAAQVRGYRATPTPRASFWSSFFKKEPTEEEKRELFVEREMKKLFSDPGLVEVLEMCEKLNSVARTTEEDKKDFEPLDWKMLILSYGLSHDQKERIGRVIDNILYKAAARVKTVEDLPVLYDSIVVRLKLIRWIATTEEALRSMKPLIDAIKKTESTIIRELADPLNLTDIQFSEKEILASELPDYYSALNEGRQEEFIANNPGLSVKIKRAQELGLDKGNRFISALMSYGNKIAQKREMLSNRIKNIYDKFKSDVQKIINHRTNMRSRQQQATE